MYKNTTVQHQMAGCQRGLSLSTLAAHGYNNYYYIRNIEHNHFSKRKLLSRSQSLTVIALN